MEIKDSFNFLVEDYGLTYKEQTFDKCYGGNWRVKTYSFYNDSGCFTISSLPQKGELDFYYSPRFCSSREGLCDKILNIRSIKPEIWNTRMKLGFIKRPFFWWSSKLVLTTLAEAIKEHLIEHEDFFDIIVKKNP